MPLYRLVIEGTGIRTRDGAVGFFATKTVAQPTRQGAEMLVLRSVREEWRRGASASLSPTKPFVKIVDCWRLGLFGRLRRVADTRHSFFDAASRAAAARSEAAHARAPHDAEIRSIARSVPPESEGAAFEMAEPER